MTCCVCYSPIEKADPEFMSTCQQCADDLRKQREHEVGRELKDKVHAAVTHSREFLVIVECAVSTRWMISEVDFALQIEALVKGAAKVWTNGAEPRVTVEIRRVAVSRHELEP